MNGDEVQLALAEALIRWWAESGGVTVEEVRAVNDGAAEAYADALAPVVDAIANQRAAEALSAAADMEVEQRGRTRDAWEYDHGIADYRRALRDRAAALTETSHQ